MGVVRSGENLEIRQPRVFKYGANPILASFQEDIDVDNNVGFYCLTQRETMISGVCGGLVSQILLYPKVTVPIKKSLS